jgi:signal transduction histidine kinase
MHGIFADETQSSCETGSGSKTRSYTSRKPHPHIAPKQRGTVEIVRAFDGENGDIGDMLKSDPNGTLLYRNGPLHDLRNLLQVISSGVGVATIHLEQGRADEVPEILRKIGRSIDKAGAQLRQMVLIPHSPMDGISAVDVAKMFAMLDAPMRWALGPACELVIAIAPDLPLVCCVEGEFENVVLNLVINARDAMPAGGRITVEVS